MGNSCRSAVNGSDPAATSSSTELLTTNKITPIKAIPQKKKVIIIGAGFGGLTACQQLSSIADEGLAEVIVIDKKTSFSVGASWQYVITDRRELQSTIRELKKAKMSPAIQQYFGYEVTNIDPATKQVSFTGPSNDVYNIYYDYLILAPGTVSTPDKVPGLREFCSDMASFDGLNDFFSKLKECKGGETICIMTSTNPYKCPPALFEFAFLADEVLHSMSTRESCRILVTNPAYPFPFGTPDVHKIFLETCAEKHIEFMPGIRPTSISKDSISYIGSEGPETGKTLDLKYDLLLGTWPQLPSPVFQPFLNDAGFVSAHLHTMETQFDGVFAVGDANWMILPTTPPKPHPKAGEFAIAAAESASVMIDQLVRGSTLEEARAKVIPGRNRKCYAESGKGTGMSINFILGADGPPSFKVEPPQAEVYEKKVEWLNNVYSRFFGE
jgi:sulfide:quinone oxidoreductase